MKIHLLWNRVLVRREPLPDTTKSGIIIPSAYDLTDQDDPNYTMTIGRELPNIGTVVYIGHSADRDLRIGDTVLFSKFHDRYLWINSERLLEFADHELLARIR